MSQALGAQATPRPRPAVTADPRGPVEPQDVPALEDIPVGDIDVQIRNGGPVLSSDIRGIPFDIDRNGEQIDREAAAERAREAREQFRERAQEFREQAEQRMREREERFGR